MNSFLSRLRRLFVVRSRLHLLLWLTLGMAGAFVITAWQTARVARTKIEMTTCYLAADASKVLQGRSRFYLSALAEPVFAAVGGRSPLALGSPLPAPDALKRADAALARCHCGQRMSVRAYFRQDVTASGSPGKLWIEVADSSLAADPKPDSSTDPGQARVPFTIPDSLRLTEAVARAILKLREDGIVAAAVTGTRGGADTLRAVAVLNAKYDLDGHLKAVYGLVVTPFDFATQVVARVFDRVPLFPAYLADTSYQHARVWGGGKQPANREIANLAVLDARLNTLYQTGPIADTAMTAPGCVGFSAPEPGLALLTLYVSPPLPVFDRWTAQSMATSQLPFLAAIMIGMLVCVAAAALAAKRETELARLRSDFVSSISHELRMPLAQILLSGETLSLGRTRSQAERDDAADAIVREAHRLAGLIDNALFFSRIEHHNIQVAPKPVELSPFVDETLIAMAPLAQGKDIPIRNTVPEGLAALLDPSAFRHVLGNLLENAIKYGPAGQHIAVGAAPARDASDRVWLWVDDEGPGIPKGQEARIFEPFVRLERDATMHVAGSGLGLAVVAHIVARHNGRVWVDRDWRQPGSRFVVELARADMALSPSTVLPDDQRGAGPSHHDAAD